MTSATHNSGPEVHPMQALERDPPSGPTGTILLVGAVITVVIVFFLEVLYVQMHSDIELPHRPGEGHHLRDVQVDALERGLVPESVEKLDTLKPGGKPIGQAMEAVVRKYGRGGR
jgi:hypothetical protein